MRINWHKFRSDERGAASLEFVIIFLPLMLLIFLIVQVAIAFHWSLSAQKGLEVGARIAAVNVPVPAPLVLTTAQGTSAINRSAANGFNTGDFCFEGGCAAVPTITCSGSDFTPAPDGTLPATDCNFQRFKEIYDAVDTFAYQLELTDLTVTYEDVGLGRVGRPYVPLITVSISEQSLPTVIRLWQVDVDDEVEAGGQETLQNGRMSFDDSDDGRVEFTIPALSSVVVAEDLGG